MTEPRMRVVAWNAEWAPPRGVRGRRVADVLAGLDADVICLTEGHRDLLPHHGEVVLGQVPADVTQDGARRVLLWSRWPLECPDSVGDPGLPHQSYAGATAVTPLGPIDLMCVCIPWADAGVARFGGTKARWEEHAVYLDVLGGMLRRRDPARSLIVAGDFNQYMPRIWGPVRMHDALVMAFDGLEFATAGDGIPGLGGHVIDHVVHSPDLRCAERAGWLGRTADDRPMSDHTGVRVDLVASGT